VPQPPDPPASRPPGPGRKSPPDRRPASPHPPPRPAPPDPRQNHAEKRRSQARTTALRAHPRPGGNPHSPVPPEPPFPGPRSLRSPESPTRKARRAPRTRPNNQATLTAPGPGRPRWCPRRKTGAAGTTAAPERPARRQGQACSPPAQDDPALLDELPYAAAALTAAPENIKSPRSTPRGPPYAPLTAPGEHPAD
jgi:hypothetical protein